MSAKGIEQDMQQNYIFSIQIDHETIITIKEKKLMLLYTCLAIKHVDILFVFVSQFT